MSGGTHLENANPVIFQRSGERLLTATDEDENVHDPIDDREIFDILFVLALFRPISTKTLHILLKSKFSRYESLACVSIYANSRVAELDDLFICVWLCGLLSEGFILL